MIFPSRLYDEINNPELDITFFFYYFIIEGLIRNNLLELLTKRQNYMIIHFFGAIFKLKYKCVKKTVYLGG